MYDTKPSTYTFELQTHLVKLRFPLQEAMWLALSQLNPHKSWLRSWGTATPEVPRRMCREVPAGN